MRNYERKEPTIGPLPGFAKDSAPTLAPEPERGIASLQQNYEQEEARIGRQPAIVCAVGSVIFVILQVLIFAAWIACNLKWIPGAPVWDRHLTVLAIVASTEAVFLVIFVLMAQNRGAAAAERRAQLQRQVNLLAEQERAKLLRTVAAIAKHLNIDALQPPEAEKPKTVIVQETAHEEDEFVGPADEF